jgi:hypothetical protein
MKYELGVLLYQGGFPLNRSTPGSREYFGGLETDGTVYEYPTFEELVEATGMDYISRQTGQWVAVKTGTQGSPTRHGRASTPRAAVACLYLAIQHKCHLWIAP